MAGTTDSRGSVGGEESVPTLIYTRSEDGSLPLQVFRKASGRRRYVVCDPTNPSVAICEHPSTRALLTWLHKTDRHWGHDRYFRQGRYRPVESSLVIEGLTVLDLFGKRDPDDEKIVVAGASGQVQTAVGSPGITVSPSHLGPVRGVDLTARHDEVAKLLFKRFGAYIRAMKWDDDDVLQEVYKGLLSRNRGKSAWDPRLSSFGSYVNLVSHSVICNYYRKKTRERRIVVGCSEYDPDGSGRRDVDVASSRRRKQGDALWQGQVVEPGAGRASERFVDYLRTRIPNPIDAAMATLVVPLLDAGYGQQATARMVGLRRTEYRVIVGIIRGHAEAWRREGCP